MADLLADIAKVLAVMDTGRYYETVMSTQRELLVPDTLKDQAWAHNPDMYDYPAILKVL